MALPSSVQPRKQQGESRRVPSARRGSLLRALTPSTPAAKRRVARAGPAQVRQVRRLVARALPMARTAAPRLPRDSSLRRLLAPARQLSLPRRRAQLPLPRVAGTRLPAA